MKHFRLLICAAVYLLLSYYAAAEILSVSSGILRIDVSDTDGSFDLYTHRDGSSDWIPLLWKDKYSSSNIRIWMDDKLVRWDALSDNAKHYADVTDNNITLFRSDIYADMRLAFTLIRSDESADMDSLMITIQVCPHRVVRRDRMLHLRDSADSDRHSVSVRICYDTYLGESAGRHFTYISKSLPKNESPAENKTADMTDDKHTGSDAGDDGKSRDQSRSSVWQRIFGRQIPKCGFDEPAGTKIIDRECEFYKFAVPFVTSRERPNGISVHLYTAGAGLTVPYRIFFADRRAADTDGIYQVRDGRLFGDYPFGREDSAAFFEYELYNIAADASADITAAVSISPNAVFLLEQKTVPDESNDITIADATSDDRMERLLNSINSQLNDQADVQQSGIDRTQNMLDQIKNK